MPAGLHVLVVDDNPTNRLILEEITRAWGMTSACAEDGPRALQALTAGARAGTPFALAPLDHHMPGMDGLELAWHITADPQLKGTAVIMLSSIDYPGEVLDAGIQCWVTKPVRQSVLRDCIARVLASTPTPQDEPEPAPPEKTAVAPETLSGRVLLAEDHPVNQTLAVSMLELLGCQVQVAENGREAAEACAGTRFDLVLMDVQMPEVDGLQATAAIRRLEQARGEERPVPIVALTANAMQSDREQCLRAGMTDYLSKPFTLEELRRVLRQWLPPSQTTHNKTSAKGGTASWECSRETRSYGPSRPEPLRSAPSSRTR